MSVTGDIDSQYSATSWLNVPLWHFDVSPWLVDEISLMICWRLYSECFQEM